ncbi:MAG: aminopeptidase P family protein [Alphaproteobacteria bacterium]|nr:aminopeptidase P family protein [Alphaproteobacteria bacterium]
MRAYRLGRVQAELTARGYGAAVLYDPINIRYATGSSNMQVWVLHNAARYAFVPAEGRVTLFDFHNCEFLSRDLETIAETRPATSWFYFPAAQNTEKRVRKWAAEIHELIVKHCDKTKRVAFDHLEPEGLRALEAMGVVIGNGQEVMEHARCIKSADEIACMRISISVCEAGMARMRESLRPGISENELWSLLHQTNIAMGGEWIETRLLASGGRTNPWYQECSDRIIRAGELVSFDTDLIGPFGYCADLSRTYFCGPGRPSDEQRRLYRHAHEQIHTNIDLLRPGMTFREFAEKSWRIPNEFAKNRYAGIAHGVGLADEYPAIVPWPDFDNGYDGVIRPGMTLCVESYIGAEGGTEGVKLEEQVLITDTGVQCLSTFPYEEALLA